MSAVGVHRKVAIVALYLILRRLTSPGRWKSTFKLSWKVVILRLLHLITSSCDLAALAYTFSHTSSCNSLMYCFFYSNIRLKQRNNIRQCFCKFLVATLLASFRNLHVGGGYSTFEKHVQFPNSHWTREAWSPLLRGVTVRYYVTRLSTCFVHDVEYLIASYT